MDGSVMARGQVQLRNLAVVGYNNGWTLWNYKDRSKTISDTMENGFFRDARTMISPGDVIYVVAADGVACLYFTSGMELAPVYAGNIMDDV